MSSPFTELGSYIAGEIPEPWVHQFLDNNNAPINLTGYQVRVTYKIDAGAQVVRNGTLNDGPTGKGQYVWISADLATAGFMQGEMTVGNGTNRYARSFVMRIEAPKGGPLPTI